MNNNTYNIIKIQLQSKKEQYGFLHFALNFNVSHE